MKIFIINDANSVSYLYVQFKHRPSVMVCEWELFHTHPEIALTKLETVVNSEFGEHIAEAFRSAFLGIPRE